MELGQVREDYLETIYLLQKDSSGVRCSEIADYLKRSRPTVTVAMSTLQKAGYIEKDENSRLHLTEKGKRLAEEIYERHCCIRNFFVRIGISPETAEEDACAVEHVLSEETYMKLKAYMEKE